MQTTQTAAEHKIARDSTSVAHRAKVKAEKPAKAPKPPKAEKPAKPKKAKVAEPA